MVINRKGARRNSCASRYRKGEIIFG